MKEGQYVRRFRNETFFSTTISVTLVLFFMGLLASALLFATMYLRHNLESLEMMAILRTDPDASTQAGIRNYLSSRPYVASVRFVSAEQALEEFRPDNPDPLFELLDGVNPLPASFNITLKADYIDPVSIGKIREELLEQPEIGEIDYPIESIAQFRDNLRKLSWVVTVLLGLSMLVGFIIIRSTVQLAIYASRLQIRTLQLIGAESGFIRKPYLFLGCGQGLIGAVLAAGLLTFLLIPLIQYNRLDLRSILYSNEFLGIIGGLVVGGTLMGLLSSWLAVNRYLHQPLEKLA